MTLEHGTTVYFHPEAPLDARNTRNVYVYFEAHGGDTLRTTRALLAEVQ